MVEKRAWSGSFTSGSYQESQQARRGARRRARSPLCYHRPSRRDGEPHEFPTGRPRGRGGSSPPPGADPPRTLARATCCSHVARPPLPHLRRAQAHRRADAPGGRAARVRAGPQQRRDDRARSSRSAYFAWRLFVLMKRRLLWRVRRKLILLLHLHRRRPVAADRRLLPARRRAHLHERQRLPVQGRLRRDRRLREARDARRPRPRCRARPEIGDQSIARIHRNASRPYPVLSLVYVPLPDRGAPRVRARLRLRHRSSGPWEHMPAPDGDPGWLTRDRCRTGRSCVPVAGRSRRRWSSSSARPCRSSSTAPRSATSSAICRSTSTWSQQLAGRDAACAPARRRSIADGSATAGRQPGARRRSPTRRHADDAVRQEPDVPRLPRLGDGQRRDASASRSATGRRALPAPLGRAADRLRRRARSASGRS